MRRRQILAAAARVFARKGFGAATIQEIAAAARLSEGSIYNYFRSKEELLIHIPQQLAQPVLSPLARPPVPRDRGELERVLRAFARGAVQRVRAVGPFLKVFLSALPYLSLPARRQYLALLPAYAGEVLEGFLRAGMRRGVLRDDLDPVVAARLLPGMLLMFLMTQEVLLGRRLIARDYDAIVEEAVRVFLDGVAVDRPAPARTPQGGRS